MARPPPPSNQNPVSFKYVPGRHRTQKWNTAKTYNYEGDDWGGYDPYEDYGGGYDQPQPPPMPAQQPYGRQHRQQSFDDGDERRGFSGPAAMYAGDRGGSPALSSASGGRPSNDYGARPGQRIFTNPEQAPPPLNTRGSPAPPGPATAPPAGQFYPPPRKSSMSSGSPAPESAPVKAEKELPTPPFVRPSDIYRRIEAEREKERQSMDSNSRPSMDSLQRETDSPAASLTSRSQRPLSSVDEGADGGDAAQQNVQVPQDFGEPQKSGSSHVLPPVQGVSSFGSDMFPGSASTDSQQTPTSAQPSSTAATNSLQTTPTATRAPPGTDPAADILAERQHTRAAPGADPAAEILAERQPSTLSHQSSKGYRSMVDRAFDADNSSNVSRSNTQSTSSISPIMSHVPLPSNSQREAAVPTIEEEPRSRTTSESYTIPRKPSPGHSRNVSEDRSNSGLAAGAGAAAGAAVAGAGAVGVMQGYRRNLDPPSSDNSPARTPGLEDSRSRRLSEGMTAETLSAETPAVPDQGVEMQPSLEPAETPASEISQPGMLPDFDKPITTGRGRAGTDYSLRESDMANAVNSSPDKSGFDEEAAQRERANQDFFLRNHSGTPTSPLPPISGRASPTKGRVAEIAGKYQEIQDASRRNSETSLGSRKSSWSNFRGSDENLPGKLPQRQGTQQSNVVSESDYGAFDREDMSRGNSTATRPEFHSEPSFRPHLPGEWVSFQGSSTGTPADEYSPVQRELSTSDRTPRASEVPEEKVDLEPNTRKVPLESSQRFAQAKNAGDALGASLVTSHGLGHQTRDFGSSQPAEPVDQPETRPKAPTGELGYLQAPTRPEITRGDTETTDLGSMASSASSVPPTPPAKDTPRGGTTQDSTGTYFNVAPLRTGRSREGSPDIGLQAPSSRFGVSPMLSTRTGPGDTENDRLRKEIVRSLDSANMEDKKREDAERTQDALDAPENEERLAEGQNAMPPAEVTDSQPPRFGMLDKRFSWETSPQKNDLSQSFGTPPTEVHQPIPKVHEPEPDSSPEIKPEMPYERPRSRGLHIMNAGDDSSEDEAVKDPQTAEKRLSHSLPVGVAGPVSPITKSQDNLLRNFGEDGEPDRSRELSLPSPVSEEARIPSYYTQDSSGLEVRPPVETDEAATAPEVDTDAAAKEAPRPISKESATSPTTPSKAKIPPFREILAIKSPQGRINAYDETRQTFADMNTGLSDWLSGMLAQHPEHASLSTPQGGYQRPALQSTMSGSKGHKVSPSIAKFTKQFNIPGTGTQSSTTGGDAAAAGTTPARTNTLSGGGSGGPDMDKLQQRGKDLMKGAGVLGGKTAAGAKGLLAKGKNRFGSTRESKGGGKV